MSQLITDNFTRANAASLGANWGTFTGTGHVSLSIAGNLATTQTGTEVNANVYTGAGWTGGADQYAEVTMQTKIAADDGGPAVRMASAAETGYFIDINDADTVALGSSMTFTCFKAVAGVYTKIIDSVTGSTPAPNQTVSAGDVLRIEAQGTTIRIKLNGATIGVCTDASIASGNPGIFTSANSATTGGTTISLFAAGDFVTSQVPFNNYYAPILTQ